MWQSLVDELMAGQGDAAGFEIVAVALDNADAARPWIEAAHPTYRCLIDVDHHVAALYHLVNVPQAVWIDEAGRIVRPPESAGANDAFRAMDRVNGTLPPDVMAERQRLRAAYLDALRDWVRQGATSAHAMTAPAATARLSLPDDRTAEAHAHFRLGRHLQQLGRADEARAVFDRASALHPDSWAMWRQAAPKDTRGLASGAAFWARVDALGDRPYYPPTDLATPSA